MRLAPRVLAVAAMATGLMLAQGTAAQAPRKTKAPPRDLTQSPAALPPPRTVTPQTYPAEQIQAGELRFVSQCGFCHGRDAAGGETGPDLTRSKLVAEDDHGDKIGPLVRSGRPDQGMPSFNMSDGDLAAIVAFIHRQKTMAESLGGGRRSVSPEDLAVGDAQAGRRYFNGPGNCSACHSPAGDLVGIASRYQGLALLMRMLYPHRGIVDGPIPPGLTAHFDQLGKYSDADMHNVYAYLATLK